MCELQRVATLLIATTMSRFLFKFSLVILQIRQISDYAYSHGRHVEENIAFCGILCVCPFGVAKIPDVLREF